MALELSGLYIYPVKSLGGIALDDSVVDARGFALDRHWMLVDEAGRFVTQRQQPRMCLVSCALVGDRLRLSAPGMPDLDIPAETVDNAPLQVEIWNDRCEAVDSGDAPAQWLSRFLGIPVRLVFLPPGSVRLLFSST